MTDRQAYTAVTRLSCEDTANRPRGAVRRLLLGSYCFFSGPPVLGGVLGDVLLPAPLLGVLGEVVLLPEAPPDMPPEVPPAAPVPEPKCASHSEREIWPSLFLSTSEKLGALELAPADAVPLAGRLDEPDAPVDELPDAPAALLPDAAGDCDLSLEDELELCATATLDRANNAAAVAVLMSFNIWSFLLRRWT
jgi:hypothetical protein